ncbi:sugar ABC transporter substrate-binding protein [Paenibacillus qinlingensis]|uniref:Multiple sugar transport system substrate-binding protein n=1 Tax=Paenibacillus qinlingensis TaxID=1837343 RepID=A0ABU1NVX9_9BACL|nr:sugar ABC transporter substrate-binding protein [Paenibacillus qinlingensis]MDR6551600.1 multiple sugar transport system substrate-binding protein [Paenibacillus qinlingensis]
MFVGMSWLLLVTFLIGCSSQEHQTQASAPSTENKVTLRMIESLTNPNRTRILKGMIAQFESHNPNIHVELISPPFGQADITIRTMLSVKQELDVLEVRDINVADLASQGYIDALNTYIATWDEQNTLSRAAKSISVVGRKNYFIANGLYQRQMFYRKDWFEAAGLKPPSTWEELYQISKKLTDPAKNRYGFSFRGAKGSVSTLDSMILAYNGDRVNLEDGPFLNDGSTIYASPEAVKAMDVYVKLYKEASPPDSIYWGFQEQVDAFTSGTTGILLQDPDVIQTIQDSLQPDMWSTAPMPTGPTGNALVSVGGAGWGMASYSKHKAEAWKLIAFLSGAKQNTELAKKYGVIPTHTSAAADSFFQTGPYKTLLDMTLKPDKYLLYKPPFQYPGNSNWDKIAMDNSQALLMGKTSIQETLGKWDAFWKEQKRNMGELK